MSVFIDRVIGPWWHHIGKYGFYNFGSDPDQVIADPDKHVVVLVGKVKNEYLVYLAGRQPDGVSFLAFIAKRTPRMDSKGMALITTECARADVTFEMFL